jgi:hypothetical protein
MTKIPRDYLKYWKVIRQFYKVKHGLTQSELDVLLFLFSEGYFDRDRFGDFDSLLAWDKDRFNKMLNDGWIEVFRKRMNGKKSLYQISDKGRNIVMDIYRKLNGEEIPTSLSQNPMFQKNVSYSDKVYRNMVKDMNTFIRQQRRQTPE